MKKLLTIFAIATISTTAVADQLIFSQFDGESTWNNVYVEVDNAADFVKPGVGFAPAFAGSESAGVEAVAGVEGKIRLVKFNYRTHLGVRYATTYRFKDNLNGRAVMVQKTYKNGVMLTRTRQRVSEGQMNTNISSIPAIWTVLKHQDRPAVEEVKEVKEVKPSWEQSLPARAIVAVDTGVDMEAFIKDFMK